MSSGDQPRPFILNVYDNMLDMAIRDVQEAFRSGDMIKFWLCLKKLGIMILEEKERKEIDNLIRSCESQKHVDLSYVGVTMADREVNRFEAHLRHWDRGLKVFSFIIRCLDNLGYLKRLPRQISSNLTKESQLFQTGEIEKPI